MLTSKEIKSEVSNVLGTNTNILLVTLFGSYARSEAKENSDIDILVFVKDNPKFRRQDLWKF
jgi:predicted nucleotidyltransferase